MKPTQDMRVELEAELAARAPAQPGDYSQERVDLACMAMPSRARVHFGPQDMRAALAAAGVAPAAPVQPTNVVTDEDVRRVCDAGAVDYGSVRYEVREALQELLDSRAAYEAGGLEAASVPASQVQPVDSPGHDAGREIADYRAEIEAAARAQAYMGILRGEDKSGWAFHGRLRSLGKASRMADASQEQRARLEELALRVDPNAYVECAFERNVEVRVAIDLMGSGGLLDICNHPRSLDAAEVALCVLAGEPTPREEAACDVLRSLASYVGNGGYNAPDPIDIDQFHAKIKEGIDSECDLWRKKAESAFGIPRAERAERELAELRERLGKLVERWIIETDDEHFEDSPITGQALDELRAAMEAPNG